MLGSGNLVQFDFQFFLNGNAYPLFNPIPNFGWVTAAHLTGVDEINSLRVVATLISTQNIEPSSNVNAIIEDLQIFPTPLPATLPLFATGLGALGLLGWRRKRKLAASG